MYYYFYDLNEKLLDRFPAYISKDMSNFLDKNARFIFIYSEKYTKNGKPTQLPKNSKVFYLPTLSFYRLNYILKKYPPFSLTTIGLRMPDMLILSYFNKKNIPTFMVQHGLFINHLERIPFFNLVYKKLSKFFKYFIFSLKISKILNVSFYKILTEQYLFFIKGSHQLKDLKYINNRLLISNKAFTFDESWDDYYMNKYGYYKNQFYYIQNPDYNLFKPLLSQVKQNAVCYICQSLVEDGRFNENHYKKFITDFVKNIGTKNKIYFKLHPRSRMSLYEHVKNENIEFVSNLPNCKFYLGHYSSLLAIVAQIGSKVMVWKLNGHDIPKEYEKYADLLTHDWSQVKKYILDEVNNNYLPNKFVIDYINKSNNPYNLIAKYLEKNK